MLNTFQRADFIEMNAHNPFKYNINCYNRLAEPVLALLAHVRNNYTYTDTHIDCKDYRDRVFAFSCAQLAIASTEARVCVCVCATMAAHCSIYLHDCKMQKLTIRRCSRQRQKPPEIENEKLCTYFQCAAYLLHMSTQSIEHIACTYYLSRAFVLYHCRSNREEI